MIYLSSEEMSLHSTDDDSFDCTTRHARHLKLTLITLQELILSVNMLEAFEMCIHYELRLSAGPVLNR